MSQEGDFNLVKLLAPYTSKPPPKNFQFRGQPTSSTSTAASSTSTGTTTKPIVQNRNRFPVYQKKSNQQFIRDFDSNQNKRKEAHHDATKDRRTAVAINNRRISASVMKDLKNTPTRTPGSSQASGQPKTVDHRKLQLEKWKLEKEELLKKSTKIIPFKGGAAPASSRDIMKDLKNLTSSGMPQLQINEKRPIMSKNKRVVATVSRDIKDASSASVQPVGVQKENRPVMTTRSTKDRLISATATASSSSVSQPVRVQKENRSVMTTRSTKDRLISTTATIKENASSSSAVAPVVDAPVQKPLPKPKGMLFDEVYMEFQTYFMQECKILTDCINKWTKFMGDTQQGIPEEVMEDIESSVGQANLLLQSKLPQFAGLLYQYLTKVQDPHQVLPADLDGWWGVALISIDKVKGRFDRLEKLSTNEWKSEESGSKRTWVGV